ncbi:isopentenyl-diphosphate delta-isomerase [Microbacteriaceae bacterium MWH-Ta3]|nr:isopentenyl-diphosphate delta-isomerase [Microbacteriaceae bacterium MWH-Ta3]
METPELVVLVDDAGTPIGTAEKATVHTDDTPLHFAFSCHVFNESGHVLVTRRALTKLTWPGVWTNSFCGHPAPNESLTDAIERRALRELGLSITDITEVLPDFRYRAIDDSGIVENEICPVFTARAVGNPNPAADEVMQWKWVDPADLRTSAASAPFAFSPWLVWQLEQWPAVE